MLLNTSGDSTSTRRARLSRSFTAFSASSVSQSWRNARRTVAWSPVSIRSEDGVGEGWNIKPIPSAIR